MNALKKLIVVNIVLSALRLTVGLNDGHAENVTWIATAPTANASNPLAFANGANWSTGNAPTAADTITFPTSQPPAGQGYSYLGLSGDTTVGSINVTLVSQWHIVAQTDAKLEVLGDVFRSGSNSLVFRNGNGILDVKIDGNLTVNTPTYFGALQGVMRDLTVLGTTTINSNALNLTVTGTASFVGGINFANSGRLYVNRYGTIDNGLTTSKLDSAASTLADIYAADASNNLATITINGGAGVSGSFSGKIVDQPLNSVGTWAPSLKIIKTGVGSQEFTWGGTIGNTATSYNGGTEINGGTLIISNTTGSGTGGGYVYVGTDGTLAGNGIITPTADKSVTVAGTVSPGKNGTGALSFGFEGSGQLIFLEGARLEFTLGASGSDRINFVSVGDWLSGSGEATLALTLGAGFDYGASYRIFDNVTTSGFELAGITGYDTANYTAIFSQVGNAYQVSFAAVPEPSTAMLIAVALGLGFLASRHLRRS